MLVRTLLATTLLLLSAAPLAAANDPLCETPSARVDSSSGRDRIIVRYCIDERAHEHPVLLPDLPWAELRGSGADTEIWQCKRTPISQETHSCRHLTTPSQITCVPSAWWKDDGYGNYYEFHVSYCVNGKPDELVVRQQCPGPIEYTVGCPSI